MVYDRSGKFGGNEKKPRIKIEGKLIGINCNSEFMEICDDKNGKFSWLQLSLITGKDKQGSDIYKNVTAYKVEFKDMPELKAADALLKEKKKPRVTLECYETLKDAVDKQTKQPIMEEITEFRNGEKVIVQKQKKWVNYRMSADDVVKTFKILAEQDENEIEEKPIMSDEDEVI